MNALSMGTALSSASPQSRAPSMAKRRPEALNAFDAQSLPYVLTSEFSRLEISATVSPPLHPGFSGGIRRPPPRRYGFLRTPDKKDSIKIGLAPESAKPLMPPVNEKRSPGAVRPGLFELTLKCRFGLFNQRRKSCRIVHRKVRKHFPVQGNTCFFQPVDEFGIIDAVHFTGRRYARNPQ